MPVVLPITSGGNFARTEGFVVTLAGAGTKTTGIIRCDQPRALDLGAVFTDNMVERIFASPSFSQPSLVFLAVRDRME